MMKLKFKQVTIDQAEQWVEKRVNSIIKDADLLGQLGDTIVKDMKFQVRKGISPKTGQPFKPLSTNKHPFLYGIYGRLDRTVGKTKKKRNELIQMREQQATQGYSWIDLRKYISQSTKTHPAFKADRSNLTLTGQLMDALTRVISGKKLFIQFTDSIHRPYKVKTKKGLQDVGKPIENNKLAEYVNAQRPFFGVRDSLIAQLKMIVIRHIRRKL